MFSRFLLYILPYFFYLCLSVSLKSQRQITISEPEPEFFTDYPLTEIDLEYKDDETLTNKEICINLQEIFSAFGDKTFDSYKTCNEKYYLLGEDHSVIQADKPECFMNLIPVFCEYDIVNNLDALFSNDLSQFIVRLISSCLNVQTDDFVCKTLNLETKIVGNAEEFCANLQKTTEDTVEQDNEHTQQLEGSEFKVYSFVGENSQIPCQAITKLYNFCQFSTQKLGLDSSRCFSSSFNPYMNGALLKKYNSNAQKACSNLLIPYFSYFVSDRDNLSDIPKVCENLETKNLAQINERGTEVQAEIESLKTNQTENEEKVQVLQDMQNKAEQKEEELKKLNETWTSFYGTLINKEMKNFALKPDKFGTVDQLNATLSGWATNAKSSLDLLRYMKPQEQLVTNQQSMEKTFELSHLPERSVSETTQVLTENLEVCAKQKSNATETQDCISLNEEEFPELNEIALEGDRKYSGFFTILDNKISVELEGYTQESESLKNNIDELSKYIQNYQEQIELSSKYTN